GLSDHLRKVVSSSAPSSASIAVPGLMARCGRCCCHHLCCLLWLRCCAVFGLVPCFDLQPVAKAGSACGVALEHGGVHVGGVEVDASGEDVCPPPGGFGHTGDAYGDLCLPPLVGDLSAPLGFPHQGEVAPERVPGEWLPGGEEVSAGASDDRRPHGDGEADTEQERRDEHDDGTADGAHQRHDV